MSCMRLIFAFKNLFRIEFSDRNRVTINIFFFAVVWCAFVALMVAFFKYVL